MKISTTTNMATLWMIFAFFSYPTNIYIFRNKYISTKYGNIVADICIFLVILLTYIFLETNIRENA